jgi:hypothetical protein
VQYTKLAERIALESGGIPDFILAQLLVTCADEFFHDSRLWRVTGEITLNLDDDEPQYNLPALLPADTYMVRVETLSYEDGTRIPAVSNTGRYPELGLAFTSSTDNIELFGSEYPPEKLQIQVSVAPTATNSVIPDDLLPYCRRALTALVLYRAYATPNREWTNTEQATFWAGQYEMLLLEAMRRGRADKVNTHKECKFSW